ncbi:low molecular weight protein-tyrosine-phosphatase [Tepidibacillus fermentans]|uniref:protein-tyrosine-phosphatase n=1 Tax=Tepidibacillus fermentans TaxID=1281767 RepID=A0A4R3KGH8_9BACI|nr:low molecular weight protein-tyrosine-phosphatase [Tepidibacillus fermentans]TCS82534.1 protein-tyrosine phosphatase [Tepidibacillus fermentans]
MIKVLFVCLGNICRSPMAEAVFRDMVKKEGLGDKITVDSAGIGHWHEGEQPHHGTRSILDQYQISYKGIFARQIRPSDLKEFDYIIAMDEGNLDSLRQLAGGKETGYIARLLDFVPHLNEKDIEDPYYTGRFDYVYQLVTKGCKHLLDFIRERQEI